MISNKTKATTAPARSWFKLFACSSFPFIGTIWLFFAAKKLQDPAQQAYARAALRYRLLMQAFAVLFLIIAAVAAVPHIKELLDYVEML